MFHTLLVLISTKCIRKLAASEKAFAKRMSTARLPPHVRERIIHLWAERENITSIIEIVRSEKRLTTRVASYFPGDYVYIRNFSHKICMH